MSQVWLDLISGRCIIKGRNTKNLSSTVRDMSFWPRQGLPRGQVELQCTPGELDSTYRA